jgi:hypothetical protein
MPPCPEAAWHEAMRQGDFARAWRISDRILAKRMTRGEPQPHLPRHLQSIWNGEPLAGKHVLVRCYHGLGDTVQFIRLARNLRSIAREVTVWVQPSLQLLMASASGIDRILPLNDGSPEIDYDIDIEIMELAHALRITCSDLPGPVPYLRPQPAHRNTSDPNRFTVGLVWSGGDWDPRRSMTLDELAPVLTSPNVYFVSLQRGPGRAQCIASNIVDVSSDDIDVLASRLREIDLLLSIDTFAAHLGGALGVPVWLMLHSESDWRWMNETDTSPWYPTMRLFRQRRAGEWTDVVADVAASLAQYASSEAREKIRNKAIDLTFDP